MEVFMTFSPLAGCTVVTLDALRHVLGGCVFYGFGMFQDCFVVDFGTLLWIRDLSGGRRRTQTPNDTKKTSQGSEMGFLLGYF